MRRRLSIMLGALAVVGLLTTPVASAAPGQSFWETFEGTAHNWCTGEDFVGRPEELYQNRLSVRIVACEFDLTLAIRLLAPCDGDGGRALADPASVVLPGTAQVAACGQP